MRVDIWTIVRSYQYLIKSLKHIYILNDIINGSPISIGLLFNDIYLKSSDRFVSLTFIQPMKNYKKRDINVIKCISLIMSELYHRIRSNDKDPFYPIQWRLYYIGYILNKFYLDLVASYTRYEYWLLKGGSYFHNIRSTCKKKSFRSVRVLTLLKHKSAGSFFMMDRYQSFKARIFYYKY